MKVIDLLNKIANGEEKDYYENYFNFKINEFEKELKKRDIYSKHILESKEE